MLSRIKSLLEGLAAGEPDSAGSDAQTRLASAVLLVEVMMADHEIATTEKDRLTESLVSMFGMQAAEAKTLVQAAQDKHEVLVSLHEMTNIINTHFTHARKLELILQMWRMAYADSRWDKYEEHLIRKVAYLLYVSHKDFIRCKHQAHGEA